MIKIPKYLTEHPAVLEVDYHFGASGGAYKWDVFLRDGWVWESGRNKGGRSFSINNRADFIYGNPIQIKNTDEAIAIQTDGRIY